MTVASRRKATDDGIIVVENTHEAIVDPEQFDDAQTRLADFAQKDSREPRADGYPLSGIILYDHCGKPMYGCQRRAAITRLSVHYAREVGKGNVRHVRDSGGSGVALCAAHAQREITDLRKMLTAPPDELRQPRKAQAEQRKAQAQERDALAKKIGQAEDNILFIQDAQRGRHLTAS